MQRKARTTFTSPEVTETLAGQATATDEYEDGGRRFRRVGITTYRDGNGQEDLAIEGTTTAVEVLMVRSPRNGRLVRRFAYFISPFTAAPGDRERVTADLGTALSEMLHDALQSRHSSAVLKIMRATPMGREELRVRLADLVEANVHSAAYTVQWVQTDPGTGIVITRRPSSFLNAYVVHRFAFRDTAGKPMAPRLYGGRYVETYEIAVRIFGEMGRLDQRVREDRTARPAQYRDLD